MDSMERTMANLTASRVGRKLEEALKGEGELDAFMNSLILMTEKSIDTYKDKLDAFKEDVGEEHYKLLAAGTSFIPVLDQWAAERTERMVVKMIQKIMEKVPDCDEVEIRTFIAVGAGQV